LGREKEDYVREYLESGKRLRLGIEPPTQTITRTAEMAWEVDSYPVEPSDEPAERNPKRGKA